jgi:hypothetical protein
VDARQFWKALVVQAVIVGALFGVLVALPLPHDFFEDAGFVVGPLAWLGCSLVTARVLSLPAAFVLFGAVAGGVAGAIVMLVAGHTAGMVVALLVFSASCASYDPTAEEAATS